MILQCLAIDTYCEIFVKLIQRLPLYLIVLFLKLQCDSNLEISRRKKKEVVEDPAQMALPTYLMAGTIFGYIFRVDLTNKVRVDVETNDLSKCFNCLHI